MNKLKKGSDILKNRKLYVIFSITLIGVMGVASITPALPAIAQSLQLTKGEIGLLISAFTFPGIFLTPVAGIMADRWGRKLVLVPALFIFSLAGFAIFFVHTFHYIILLRIVQGIGAAPLGSLNATLIADFFRGKERPQAMGYNASVLSLSTASYPLIGGALAGIAWYYPFLMPLLAVPVGLFVIFGISEPEIDKSASFSHYLKGISKSILKREIIAILLLGMLTFIILYGAFLTYMPFLLQQEFGLSAPQIGVIISLSSFTTAFFATQVGRFTWKFGSLKLLKTAFFLYLLVTILMPNIHHLLLFVLPVLLFGTAQALNLPSLNTMLADHAPENQRGVFMSFYGMLLRLGQTLGPLVIGIGYSIKGISGAFYLGSFTAVAGLAVLFFLMGSIKKPTSDAPL
jgi:MFS family permease